MGTLADLHDRSDFDDAARGFIAALDPPVITNDAGQRVWDLEAYAFLHGDCPPTADPSLWRQGQLCEQHGLYEVTDGIYQVRGYDISNMTLVEGDTGVIVIDPLISCECAAASFDLYRRHRGDRPITAMIYTHSHVDHFGGARGLIGDEAGIPIVAPVGFMHHAVAENVYAGTAMLRRASYMYGRTLPIGPAGHIGCGLGLATSGGTTSLIAPNLDITHTGQEEVLDGVRIVFQLTPDSEAPAEMHFHFPERRALCIAENATKNLHNLVTLRGALVRDAHNWSRYIDDAINRFADSTDVAFASHHWPTFGTERVVRYLAEQRDLYAYLHDQTLRMMNQGHTGTEIAELLEMPPALDRAWHTHGYYGSVSHNVKAIYQRYLGWFDGNPANLWRHPPVASATRYVECMGGVDAVVVKARGYIADGDLRFAVQLLDHAVFAEPAHRDAAELLASTYEQLGYGAENATWRNFFLTGAKELREGPPPARGGGAAMGMLGALDVEQVFDFVALRLDGPRAWDVALAIDWVFTDLGRRVRTTLSNGVLSHTDAPRDTPVDLTVTLTKPQLFGVLLTGSPDGVTTDGDTSALGRLRELLDTADASFAIVTP
jgi:alkyl sulfatase BDS1-like metallo-beta-lactamase superfamily hydrolase